MPIVDQWRLIRSQGADLIVDLAGSLKSRLLTAGHGARLLRYAKDRPGLPRHAVTNFLATLAPLALAPVDRPFPSVTPDNDACDSVRQRLERKGLAAVRMVALVPGVGRLRPHRAWGADSWMRLCGHLSALGFHPLLVGGEEDRQLCSRIESAASATTFAGDLSLTETAALLKMCRLAVSGDTGPAHIAVAVGTPVIGLYGPTYPARSGPFGCEALVVDHSAICRCHGAKSCVAGAVPPEGPGLCMTSIDLAEVVERLDPLLAAAGD